MKKKKKKSANPKFFTKHFNLLTKTQNTKFSIILVVFSTFKTVSSGDLN